MHSCDVLIVGGGPAGSSCAWGLRHSGLDVAILDKAIFPRDKICGGWITPAVLSDLELDPSEYSRDHVLQQITGFRTGCIDSSSVETSYGATVSYGICRNEFDDYLLKRSRARLFQGMALKKIERSADRWIANDQISARVVIGAGGHFCPVPRLLGVKAPTEAAVVAQEVEFEMGTDQRTACNIRSETPELYFCPDMKGYGWCFRKGNLLNVGLGRADPHRLPMHVADFLRFLNSSERLSFDVPALRGHAYLLGGTSTRTTVGNGVLLIGDAAGLAYPQSGEGIRPAVESGLLAAKTIAHANGRYSQEHLESYRTQLAATIGISKQGLLAKIGQRLPSQIIPSIARHLLRKQWFVRDIVLNQWFLRTATS